MAIMNYNDWFHEFHQYLTGVRKGHETFNDTKWKNMYQRYKTLIEMEPSSVLLDEQPYNIVGNVTGFQMLIDLMERSNYTFEDLDNSLAETYRMSLQNAMSRMLVNTHCVVAKYNYLDKKHVSRDKYSHYFFVDVPFDQMHFGERDEFIRQRLHDFYETENKQFIPASRFLSDEISSILRFTIICCTNGYMSDDWFVGIDEKGFRFKIGWRYSSDVDFIIYKLDGSKVLEFDVPITILNNDNPVIRYRDMGISNVGPEFDDSKCIIQVSDTIVRKEILIPPNFGSMTRNGCNIVGLQKKTKVDFDRYKSETAHVRIYMIKYFREVSGMFPAVNYWDIMGTQYVYDDQYHHVTNKDGYRIHAQDTTVEEKLPICTPPIALNRTSKNISSFHTLKNCYKLTDELKSYQDEFLKIGQNCNTPPQEMTDMIAWYTKNVINPTKYLLSRIKKSFETYYNGALLTSLIDVDYIKDFSKLLMDLEKLSLSAPNYNSIQSNVFDMLYGDNYTIFLKHITAPLRKPPFTTLGEISSNYPNYFNESTENDLRVHRPISEQCFITVKYNHDDDVPCWVFDAPEIKHFKGIDNIFYVDSELDGREVYKFFYLYTDTEDPAAANIDRLSESEFLDFDEFVKAVNKHIGYVKYWYAENQLAKFSYIYYQKHDVSTELSILTKIMKRKLDGETFLEYPSEMNYEFSNVTTDNVKDYTESSERAPFAVNFMFYTLAMLSGNEDKLAYYFLNALTDKKFYPRYADLKLSEIKNDELVKEKINYSVIHTIPLTISSSDKEISEFPEDDVYTVYAGIPYPLNTTHDPVAIDNTYTTYPYVFNVYESNHAYPYIIQDGLDNEHFVKLNEYTGVKLTFYDDARIANMVSIYLAEVYNVVNDLVTNYKTQWNTRNRIRSLQDTIKKHYTKISSYINERGLDFQPHYSDTNEIELAVRNGVLSNPLYTTLTEMDTIIEKLLVQPVEAYPKYTIFKIVNQILMRIEKVYECTGFVDESVRYVRRLYMQLKQINQPMSLYGYKRWCETLDLETLISLSMYYVDNPNVLDPAQKQKMITWCGYLRGMILKILQDDYFGTMEQLISDLTNPEFIVAGHLASWATYCNDVVQDYIFDLYVMNPIHFTNQQIMSGQPCYATITFDTSDTHVITQYTGEATHYTLTAHVDYEQIAEQQYKILRIVPTCESAFRNGSEPMTVDIQFYTNQGVLIDTISSASVTFTKISNSADILKTFERFVGAQFIPMEVANVHERFDINGDNQIVNKRHAELHYELLCGNHFVPLTHLSEYCNPERDESLQGPIDKLYLSCEKMNRLSMIDQTDRPEKTMFFKPCQVYHTEVQENEIASLGGKYFVGQTVYAYTDDGLSLFPMIITAIDHSQQRGILELKVDEHHARWFETTDPSVMTKYLTTDITCTIVDDNIRNFLDEFSEYDGEYYPIPPLSTTAHVPSEYDDNYSLPGDPIFVETNSDYVYTRLNWMFHDEIPNRLSSEIDPKHHFVYIGSVSCYNETTICINMINHDFNAYTNPELYPELRDEPDDHNIWKEEKRVFTNEILTETAAVHGMTGDIRGLSYRLVHATTTAEKREIEQQIEELQLRIDYKNGRISQLQTWLFQLEKPSTWYNVISYDAAMIYIGNGRASLNHSFKPHVQDLPYTNQLEIKLYDWEHKEWIDPNVYSVATTVETDAHFPDDVTSSMTKNVLTKLTINFLHGHHYDSKKILIYFVYDHSDIFDSIPMNSMECQVRFRPVLSLDKPADTPDKPYERIRLRKHYDENEVYYPLELLDVPEDFPEENAIMFHRPDRSGLFTTGSPIRFCDMKVKIENAEYSYNDFDIYIEHPIKNVSTDPNIMLPEYTSIINRPFDGFAQNTYVTLACVNNNEHASFNGIASSVMFNAYVSGTEEEPVIQVLESTVSMFDQADFVCYIIPSNEHPMSGGVITVSVSYQSEPLRHYGDWVKLSEFVNWQGFSNINYRLIPSKVILVPKDNTLAMDMAEVYLQNHYQLDTLHDVQIDNTGEDDLFTVYYDTEKELRYPVGNVLKNSHLERLTIDYALNPNVNTIRTNYIGICRYALQKIPQDGIIDLTGYITTPLSRDRYEIWVNGRYITNPENLIILSPTSFQLRNLTSLRNLDVIELTDDVIDSSIFRKGNMYIDLKGNVYGSYKEILKRHANIMDESVKYAFNTNTKYKLDEYLSADVRESNNINAEPDIMDNITIDESTIVSYNQIHQIPTINGVPVYNLTSTSMGFLEYSNRMLLEKYDIIWKRERMNGDIQLSHMADYDIRDRQIQRLHVKKTEDGYEIYTTGITDYCFTLYISDVENGAIDDPGHVYKIMPMLRSGVIIKLDQSFTDKWLMSTIPNTPTIQIK